MKSIVKQLVWYEDTEIVDRNNFKITPCWRAMPIWDKHYKFSAPEGITRHCYVDLFWLEDKKRKYQAEYEKEILDQLDPQFLAFLNQNGS